MATWSKVKQQMESFLADSLCKQVEYSSGSYRYSKEKGGQCYLKVEGIEVFSMLRVIDGVKWYENEIEIKKSQLMEISIEESEIIKLQTERPKIPVERLRVMLYDQKQKDCAKRIYDAQNQLLKSNFMDRCLEFLGNSIDYSMNSEDILLNVFALIDRRMGKSRLRKMRQSISLKHSIVQYFYKLRCEAENL